MCNPRSIASSQDAVRRPFPIADDMADGLRPMPAVSSAAPVVEEPIKA